MKPTRPVSIELDQQTRDHLKRLTDARDRSTDAMQRDAFRAAGREAWAQYQADGLHITHDEADAWLARLGAGEDAAVPRGHL